MEQENSKYTLEGGVLVGISQTAWLSQIFLLLIILYVHFKRGFDGIVGGAGCYLLLPLVSHVFFCKSLLLVWTVSLFISALYNLLFYYVLFLALAKF